MFVINIHTLIYHFFCVYSIRILYMNDDDNDNDTYNDETTTNNSNQPTPTPNTSRRFVVGDKDITISCILSSFSSKPSSTKLTPPMTWLTSSGSKVKILHTVNEDITNINTNINTNLNTNMNSNMNTNSNSNSNMLVKDSSSIYDSAIVSSMLEITVSRSRVDRTLTSLRMNGFQKEDLYRLVLLYLLLYI